MIRRSARHQSVIVAGAILAFAAWYLAIWRHMPIYPDETSLRLQGARAIVDNWIVYSPMAQCVGGVTNVPFSLRPFAYLFSAFDLQFQWAMVRSIPILAILAVFGVSLLIIMRRGITPSVGLLLLAIVGVAPSGLVVMRYEVFLILQIGACLTFYYVMTSPRTPAGDLAALLGFSFFTLLSDSAHPQALLFFPVSLLMMFAFIRDASSKTVGAVGIAALAWLCLGAYGSLAPLQRRCVDLPGLDDLVSNFMIFGPKQSAKFLSGLQPWLDRISLYISHFTFNAAYPENYLPGLDERRLSGLTIRILNAAIAGAVVFNLISVVAVSAGATVRSAKTLFFGHAGWIANFRAFSMSGNTLIGLIGFAHLAMLVVITSDAYYRSHYLNFAFALINTLAISSIGPGRRQLCVPLVIVVVFISIGARILTATSFDDKFRAGWAGPSLSMLTDWKSIRGQVSKLANACGIKPGQPRIIVDDRSFSALREYPHLIAFTYLAWGRLLDKNPEPTIMDTARKYGSAILLHCANFGPSPPAGLKVEGDYCCADF